MKGTEKITDTVKLVAPCLFGLEKFVGEEIDALGYKRIETIDGRVYFEAPIEAIPILNISLRCAERVLVLLGSFTADTFDSLFEGTKALSWEEWLPRDAEFPVNGHSVKSKLFSLPNCQKIVKKAICDRLSGKYGLSRLPESGAKYPVEFFILKDRADLMIDTTGVPLHKRGYRPESVAAPLRETLAAALVKLSRPRENVLLWDPMCGSGTIPIEAAMIMTGTAPGLKRSFISEKYGRIPAPAWSIARDKARSEVHSTDFEAFASDIDPAAVKTAEENIRRAGMETVVKPFVKDALTITTEGRRGTVICNPPYGERISTPEEAEKLYRAMGAHFKTLDNWQLYIITSSESFESLYGRRADKVRKLYNGMIPCFCYQFFKPFKDGRGNPSKGRT